MGCRGLAVEQQQIVCRRVECIPMVVDRKRREAYVFSGIGIRDNMPSFFGTVLGTKKVELDVINSGKLIKQHGIKCDVVGPVLGLGFTNQMDNAEIQYGYDLPPRSPLLEDIDSNNNYDYIHTDFIWGLMPMETEDCQFKPTSYMIGVRFYEMERLIALLAADPKKGGQVAAERAAARLKALYRARELAVAGRL